MKLNLVSYGIAKEIIGSSEIELQVESVNTIGDLKNQLVDKYPKFQDLVRFSLAVNEEYQEDGYQLNDGDEVVVIPPVSGG